MTAQLLISELSNLIQDSKRKYPDLRSAAEKSLNELKALPNTSEAQLAADLKNRPTFVNPFVIACRTGSSKHAGSGVACLLRLTVSNGLSVDSLVGVLDAFRECASLALEVQLKVLQALPSLLQNYSSSIQGKLLISTLQICFLLHGSKSPIASNTAAATLQQLLAFTFEKVALQDETSSDETLVAVQIQDGPISVSNAAADAYYLLDDICLLASGKPPKFLRGSSLAAAFGLELIESSLVVHIETFSRHAEQIYVLQNRLMPIIIQSLSGKASFALTVRSMRLLRLLTRRLLSVMPLELEIAIDLTNHALDPKVSPEWKRALCLEFFQEIHNEPNLLRAIYAQYDEQKTRKNIVSDHLAFLVRLAAEKPAIIGSGQQISEPDIQHSVPAEQIAIESGGIAGAIATPALETRLDKLGLNVQWSTIRTPCIDMIDKAEPPLLPATYIYVLALTCIVGFSEGLAKFLLPFTVPTNSKLKQQQRAPSPNQQGLQESTSKDDEEDPNGTTYLQRSARSSQPKENLPINPLALEDHEMYDQICTSASIVEHCWPALLATSSTFLNASLDSEYLHALIRSFQKFTQIAGLLALATPRDAFLTTLAKHAVPTPLTDLSRTPTSESNESSDGDAEDDRNGSEDESNTFRGISTRTSREINLPLTSITARNLLCLRALLNLGIALGPVLGESWTIVLETLHQVDTVLLFSNQRDIEGHQGRPKPASGNEELITEKDAVELTVSRLFQSTSDLPDQAYLQVLHCLSTLAYGVSGLTTRREYKVNAGSSDILSSQAATPRHYRFPSISNLNLNKSFAAKDSMLILDRIAQLAQCNLVRLRHMQTTLSGWSNLMNLFIDHLSLPNVNAEVRIGAAGKLTELLEHLISSTDGANKEQQSEILPRCLDALATAISSVCNLNATKGSSRWGAEVHAMGLETLNSILEQRGEVLFAGWETVFAIVGSAMESAERPIAPVKQNFSTLSVPIPRSIRLVRLAFASLQLICSDFLDSVPESCFITLLDTLFNFCSQKQDFNISLSSIAFFRSLSDFLLLQDKDSDCFAIEANGAELTTESDLIQLIDAQDNSVSRSVIWVSLLFHLAQLIADQRSEVRYSALHTLFGIIDACGDRLDAKAWTICFRVVFFKILSALEDILKQKSEANDEEDMTWDDTSILLIRRLSTAVMQAFAAFSGQEEFLHLWGQLLAKYTGLLDCKRLKLSGAVFGSLTEILAVVRKAGPDQSLALDPAFAIWQDHNPSDYNLRGATDNHDALVAYLQYIYQLHGLLVEGFNTAQAKAVIANLEMSITKSTALVYGSDVDEMTAVQKLVLENMKLIPTTSSGVLVQLVDKMAFLITLVFHTVGDQVMKGKTYVALSKATMAALEDLITDRCANNDVPIAYLLFLSFRALETPIRLKYKWQYEGKGISTWQKATLTALSLLDARLLRQCEVKSTDTQNMWTAIVDITSGIVTADTDNCASFSAIGDDQAFDMDMFSKLTEIIIPILGSSSLQDQIRRRYVESIFHSSIIHEPHPDDLARPDQELLDGLGSQHVGRVQDLPPRLRSKMAYALLDHIFDLVAVHDGSVERIKLAQAAAPYLILRTGLVLKAYVSDQPLRGRMPQPLSQKREMHYVLKRLVDLKSEPKAFPETMGVQSQYKKHLFLLFGLVTKALKAAWRDEEMSAALQRVLDTVGMGFGL